MLWMTSAWLTILIWDVFLLQCIVFILCWKQQEDKSYWGESLLTSRDLPTQSLLFGPTQILPERETRQQINRYWQTDDISESLGRRVKLTWIMVRLPLSPWTLCFTANWTNWNQQNGVIARWWWIRWSNYSVFSQFEEKNVLIFQDQWTWNFFLAGMRKHNIYTVYEKSIIHWWIFARYFKTKSSKLKILLSYWQLAFAKLHLAHFIFRRI